MPARPVSTSQKRAVVAGAAVIVVVVVLAVFSLQSSNGLPGTPKTTVRAAFAQVGSQLVNGNDVTINGNRVGQVKSVAYQNGEAVVTMLLRGSFPMYADATASIDDYALLGQEVVSVSPGTRTAGPLHGPIPMARTESATNLQDVLNVLTPSTRTALQTTLTQLGGGLSGQGQDINRFLNSGPSTLSDVSEVAQALSSPQANLSGLLDVLDALSTKFYGHSSDLSGLLTGLNATLDAINTNNDVPFNQIIADLPSTLRQANTALVALNQPLADTQTAMTDIGPGAASLGQATPSLQSFLTGAVDPLGKVPGVADVASPAADALTTTFADAQPLVPRLDEGLASALLPVQVVSLHISDLQGFSTALSGVTETHDSTNPFIHYIRAEFPVNATAADGLVTQPHDPYPPPGRAFTEKEQ